MISSWIEYLTVRKFPTYVHQHKKSFSSSFWVRTSLHAQSAHFSSSQQCPHYLSIDSSESSMLINTRHTLSYRVRLLCAIMLHRWSEFPVRSLVTTQKLARWTGKKCPGYERRKEKHHRSARSLRKTAEIITGELPQLREEIGNTMKTKVAHFSFHNRLYSLATGEINFDLIEIVRGDRWSSWWWKRRPTSTGSN